MLNMEVKPQNVAEKVVAEDCPRCPHLLRRTNMKSFTILHFLAIEAPESPAAHQNASPNGTRNQDPL